MVELALRSDLFLNNARLIGRYHMPFSPISVNSKVFNQAGEGKYSLNSVTFGEPADYFIIKGGSLNKPRTSYVSSVTRVLEKDVVVGGVYQRRSASVQLIITIPSIGFVSYDVDNLTLDISEFLSGSVIDRLLNGES